MILIKIDKIDMALIALVFMSFLAILFSNKIGLSGDAFQIVSRVLESGMVALGFKKVPQNL